ncbi:MAG TPA: hypothetical protein VFX24_14395 [Ktedonobacterales bacterium]|nr:hypothetical protein [Ktedonobacterales bacterium]
MSEDSTSEIDAANRPKTKGKRRRSVVWLLAVCASIFLPLTMFVQSVLKILEDDNVFTTPQIVYDILFFVSAVVSLPAMAIVTWMYLKRHPKLLSEWAIWPLAAGALIIIPGVIVLASANLFVPNVLTAQLWIILLYAILGAVCVSMFSIVVLMIRIEFGRIEI